MGVLDRGLIDAAAALEALAGEPAPPALAARPRYHRRVFLAPPWPEIYVTDPEHRHGLAEAIDEYHRLEQALHALGYEIIVPPKFSVSARADFLLATLSARTWRPSQAPDSNGPIDRRRGDRHPPGRAKPRATKASGPASRVPAA